MFNDLPLAWSDFFGGGGSAVSDPLSAVRPRTVTQQVSAATEEIDRVTTDTSGVYARNVQELQARIKAAGGALTVGPNSSDYVVAINNRLKFSVTAVANGQFTIRESSNYLLLAGLAAVAGILLLVRR